MDEFEIEELLAGSIDAERRRRFAGEDWGDLIASGHMNIEDAWDTVEEETEEDRARREWREKWPGSEEEKIYNYVELGIKMEGYEPSEQVEIAKKAVDAVRGQAVEVYY